MMQKTGKEVVSVNRTEYKNQHAKEHYDRINFKIPIGEKERIRAAASAIGMYLKDGFINDVTGSRSIHCEKTSEVRRVIGKTHIKDCRT